MADNPENRDSQKNFLPGVEKVVVAIIPINEGASNLIITKQQAKIVDITPEARQVLEQMLPTSPNA